MRLFIKIWVVMQQRFDEFSMSILYILFWRFSLKENSWIFVRCYEAAIWLIFFVTSGHFLLTLQFGLWRTFRQYCFFFNSIKQWFDDIFLFFVCSLNNKCAKLQFYGQNYVLGSHSSWLYLFVLTARHLRRNQPTGGNVNTLSVRASQRKFCIIAAAYQ